MEAVAKYALYGCQVDDEMEAVAKKMELLQKDVEGHQENVATLEEKLSASRENQQGVSDVIRSSHCSEFV